MAKFDLQGNPISSKYDLEGNPISQAKPTSPKKKIPGAPPEPEEGLLSGVLERGGELLKAPFQFMGAVAKNTPGHADVKGHDIPFGTLYPPTLAVGVGKTLYGAGKAGVESAAKHLQSAEDAYNVYDKELQAKLARGEDVGGVMGEFTNPNVKEALAQGAFAVGVPEVETEEVIPGSGGALVPTRKALGRLAVDTVAANPPVETLGAAARAVPGIVKAVPANIAAALRRSPLGKAVQAEQAAADLRLVEGPGPLEHLDPSIRGTAVGEAEKQALNLRMKQAEKLYAPLNDVTLSARELLDPEFDILAHEVGHHNLKIPPRVEEALKAVKAAKAKLPEVAEGTIATSPEMEKALEKLDNLPFSEIRKLRSQVGNAAHSPNGAVRYAARQMYSKLSGTLEDAAEGAGMRDVWDNATQFYKDEIVGNHKTVGSGETRQASMGKQISKKAPVMQETAEGVRPVGGSPEKMYQVLSPGNPQDVVGMHRALVPKFEGVSPAATQAGQKAFDHGVLQTVEARIPKGANGALDLSKLDETILDTKKIGPESWQAMKDLSSPATRMKLENMEKVAAAYKRLAEHEAAMEGMKAPIASGPLSTAGAALGAVGGSHIPGLPYHSGAIPGMMAGAAAGSKLANKLGMMRYNALEWAIQHPARTEILTAGMAGASAERLPEIAARNISNIIRLYDMDTSRPPAMTGGKR